jgi:hypothetical protein
MIGSLMLLDRKFSAFMHDNIDTEQSEEHSKQYLKELKGALKRVGVK